MKRWREAKACIRCGYVRTVLVYLDTVFRNGKWEDKKEEHYAKHCRACEFAANARKYRRLAEVNDQRAREAYARQAKRSQRQITGD